ncbi:MAG: hypothetical protein ACRDJC_19420, partial [Thermomicrobiales bacterium]
MRISRIAGVLAVAMVTSGAIGGAGAQTGTPVAEQEPVSLAFFMAAAANSYAQAQLEGVQEVAEGLNATVATFDGQFDSQAQYSQLQDAIASG